MFRSLRSWNFRVFFAGILVSNLGLWMQRTAQDWIVLTELTDHDAFALGVMTAFQFGPQVFLTAPAGLLADRLDRRRYLILTQSLMGLIGIGLAIVAFMDVLTFPLMCAFALALGILTALDLPARQSFVTQLVEPPNISNAVSLTSAGFNIARLAGPAIAGVMVATVGAGWVFAVNAVTFSLVIIAMALVRPTLVRPVIRATGSGRMKAAARYIWQRPDLRFIVLGIFIFGALGWNFPVFTTTMASVEFGAGAATFGLLTSSAGFGAIVGGLVVASRRRVRMHMIVAAAGGIVITGAACALAPTVAVFAATLALFGAAASGLTTASNAHLQATSDDDIRGRVVAVYWSVFIGSSAVGAPTVGWVANELGPRWALAIASLSGVVIIVLAVATFFRRDGGWDPSPRVH